MYGNRILIMVYLFGHFLCFPVGQARIECKSLAYIVCHVGKKTFRLIETLEI